MLPSTGSSAARPTVAVVATDVVGMKMAGPGIRAERIAAELAVTADVTLLVSGGDAEAAQIFAASPYAVRTYGDANELVRLLSDHDVAVSQILDRDVVRRASASGCRFVFDLYNALPAEAIGSDRIGGADTQPEMDEVFLGVLDQFRFALTVGSYFITSNERQRDFWIGYMMACGALMPSTLAGRRTSEIIGLVPFGMESGEPIADSRALRGFHGIGKKDFILLWAGGIWDWFDAETPIRAVAALRASGRNVRLVFYGTTHPNHLIGRPAAVERAISLAASLGVLDDGVHFIEGWVPAQERAQYLLDADAAISAHTRSFETRYAFRTRILDHFWASLPSIVSDGDWFADYIVDHGLGEVVPCGDVEATKAAILRLMRPRVRRAIRRRVQAIRHDWTWSATTRPLVQAITDWQRFPQPMEHETK